MKTDDPSILAKLKGTGPDLIPLTLKEAEEGDTSHMVRVGNPGSEEAREGRYRVIGEIARGGVGIVMKGHDVDLGRDVAMKVIRDEYSDHPQIVQRFVEEAQIGGQLQHPGIVPVYEIGLKADSRPYFTMKLVKGKTLAALLGERDDITKGRRRYLSIFESVCQTVGYAHARGVIHRDLKPSNVMVGAFGEVVVVDWGMGKVLKHGGVADEKRASIEVDRTIVETVRSDDDASASMVGSVLGTPRYMPPEQARGDLEAVDERSDVFALGGVLCAILTGQPTYAGDGAEVLQKSARGEVQEAIDRLEASGADRELIDLAAECLSPAPTARPAHAGLVAKRIGKYLTSVEDRVQEARIEAAEAEVKAAEERKARRLTALLAAVVLLAVVGAGGAWWWLDQRQQNRENRITAKVDEALREATLHRGQERWPEALGAATRAEELAAEAPEDVRRRAASERANVAREAEAAAREVKLRADNRRLLESLEAARPSEGDARYPTDWSATNRACARAFEVQGIDVDKGTAAEAAELLRARGISTELAAALDGWVVVRSELGEADGAERLSRIADLLDGDPKRNRIRLAILERDAEILKTLASSEDLLDLPVVTLQLLGSGLRNVGAYPEAAEMLERAHRRHPRDFLICLHFARALHQSGHPLDSASFYMAVLALRPDSPVAVSEAGQELINVSEAARAEAVFREGIRRWPEDAILHVQLAMALLLQGRGEDAEAASEAAVRIAPNSAWVRAQRGLILLQRGRSEEAMAQVEEALRLGPDVAQIQWMASTAYGWLNDTKKAYETALRAVELDPTAPWSHLSLTRTMAAMGRQIEAIEVAREAVRRGPQHAETHAALGAALAALRFLDEGIAELRTATRINDRSIDAWLQLMFALFFQGRNIEAAQCIERLRGLGLTEAVLHPQLVELWEKIERRAKAEPRLIAILEGHVQARGAEEMVDAALVGARREWPHAAVQQMKAAFETDREYTADPTKYENHYGGCIAAARAVLGLDDARDLDAKARAEVGAQGLAWLRELLEMRRNEAPHEVVRIMIIWLEGP